MTDSAKFGIISDHSFHYTAKAILKELQYLL